MRRLLIAVAFLTSGQAIAAEAASATSYLGKYMVSLLIVFGLIWIAYLFVTRFQKHRFNKAASIRIVDTISLGQREKLATVAFQDKLIMIGVTANGIAKLGEVDLPEEYVAQEVPAEQPVITFKSLLQTALNNGSNKHA